MAVKTKLTTALCNSLCFDEMLVGFTKSGARKLQRDHGKHNWIVRDTVQQGLYLRLTPGTASWYVQRKVAGRPVQRMMGHMRADDSNAPRMSLDEARTMAVAWLGELVQGIDPLVVRKENQALSQAKRDRDRYTLGVVFSEYVQELSEIASASTTTDRKKVHRWMQRAPLWAKPLADITRGDVKATLGPLLDRVKGKTLVKPIWGGPKSISIGTLNKIYQYLAGAWEMGAEKLKLTDQGKGPFKSWRAAQAWPAQTERSTFLDTDAEEGTAWLKGLIDLQQRAQDPILFSIKRPDNNSKGLKPHSGVLIDFYVLVLLWGTRKTETALLRWEQVDFKRRLIILDPQTTKNKKIDTVPLTEWATQILHTRKELNALWRPDEPSPWVFPSRRRITQPDGTKALCPLNNPRSIVKILQKETGLLIGAHDLRRTMATELVMSGDIERAVQELVIAGAALHHTAQRGGITSAATQRYLVKKADALRKVYQEREDKLRAQAGLPPLREIQPQEDETDNLLERAEHDPDFRRALIEKLMGRK
jgi:integrase